MSNVESPYFVVKVTRRDRMAMPGGWEWPPAERHKTKREAEKAAEKLAAQMGEEYDVLSAGDVPPNYL